MLKRIFTVISMDMAGSFRDSVALYSLISPVILAVIIRLLIPSLQDVPLTLSVSGAIDTPVIERLKNYGNVGIYDSKKEIIERVNHNDDAIGIYCEHNRYVIIAEGNEDPEVIEGVAAFLADATDTLESASFTVMDLQGKPVPVAEYLAVIMLMLSMLIGGILIGFNIVDEKETKAIAALAVSPLRITEYILARGFIALVTGVITGYLSCIIILGMDIDYAAIGVSIIFSLSVAIPFGFILGSFSDNQLTAFALVKLLMVIFLTLPVVSIFVPEAWQWVFYLLPNYWMFLTMKNAVLGTAHVGFLVSAIITVVSGFLLIGLLFPKMRKGLKLR